ncbi:dual OB domain-containing protein [Streptomyces sparsogenes]|uniref:dual OB domain-containing protein n=1 Tax=Streptomyces sparsogenes TaxID=67365 RepID=UPI003F4D4CEB
MCLANSRKHGGRCIAGVERREGKWIRPVSSRDGEAVSESERRYASGAEPRVLDIISMRLIEHRPDGFQCENWLVDPTIRWRRNGRIGWDDLYSLEQHPAILWHNGNSSGGGINDQVPAAQQKAVMGSLKLIRVDAVDIRVDRAYPQAGNQKFDVRAHFRYAGSLYALKVTDPIYEEKYRDLGLGRYGLTESFLTISLGKEFNGHLYKLVAAIIERAEVESGGRL